MKLLKKLIIGILLVFSLASCSKRGSLESNAAKSYNRVELYNFLVKNGVTPENYQFVDNFYASLDKTWMHSFTMQFYDYQNDFGQKYGISSIDCDDYSAMASCYAKLTTKRGPNLGIPFGEYYFWRDDGIKHALNFAILNENTGLKLIFFEPQNCKPIILSETERRNGIFLRL